MACSTLVNDRMGLERDMEEKNFGDQEPRIGKGADKTP
jgi:hypothetical protein